MLKINKILPLLLVLVTSSCYAKNKKEILYNLRSKSSTEEKLSLNSVGKSNDKKSKP